VAIHIININGATMAVMIDDDPRSSNDWSGQIGVELEATGKVSFRNVWLKSSTSTVYFGGMMLSSPSSAISQRCSWIQFAGMLGLSRFCCRMKSRVALASSADFSSA